MSEDVKKVMVRRWAGTSVGEAFNSGDQTQEQSNLANETYRIQGTGELVEWESSDPVPSKPTAINGFTYVRADYNYMQIVGNLGVFRAYRIAGTLAAEVFRANTVTQPAAKWIRETIFSLTGKERLCTLEIVNITPRLLFSNKNRDIFMANEPVAVNGFTYWTTEEL